MKIKVLSLFDGISCGRVALERLGYEVEYYAAEVDKYAIQIAQKNYPDTIQLGDVTKIDIDREKKNGGFLYNYPYNIDLLIGGSPCQDLSIAKKDRKGLDGNRSGLFWEYVRILKEVKPRYFVLENVASMPKKDKDIITKELGVEPIIINASLVSAQQRRRLFWTNIPNVLQPDDRGILLKDVIENGYNEKDKSYCIDANYFKGTNFKTYTTKGKRQLIFNKPVRVGQIGKGGQGDRVYSIDGKSVCLSANGGGRGAKTGLYQIPHGYIKEKLSEVDKYPTLCAQNPGTKHKLVLDDCVRKLTPIECERLQSLPDNYTEGISNTQRYKCLGNAFNVEVVKHILKNIKL